MMKVLGTDLIVDERESSRESLFLLPPRINDNLMPMYRTQDSRERRPEDDQDDDDKLPFIEHGKRDAYREVVNAQRHRLSVS